jgi:hypothetical protein
MGTTAGAAQAPFAKGATLRATLDFVRGEAGEARLEAVLARLAPGMRRQVEEAPLTAEVPFTLLLALWTAADEVLRADHPDWIERSGARSIESSGQQLYGGILRKQSPEQFLTQSVSLFRLYYGPGDMQVVETEPGRAILRLVGFGNTSPLFCRRQTGGLGRALTIAGGHSAAVRHVRCALEGDAFCEWELRWS